MTVVCGASPHVVLKQVRTRDGLVHAQKGEAEMRRKRSESGKYGW